MANVAGGLLGGFGTGGGGYGAAGSGLGLGGALVPSPVEPTITFTTSGTIDYGDVIELEIDDADDYVIVATFGSTREIVWDGAFGTDYQGPLNTETSGVFAFLRDGGWPTSALNIRVMAFGELLADESEDYPVNVLIPTDTTHTPELTAEQLAFVGVTDLLLDSDGDLDITGGRLSFTSGASGVAQAIKIRLQSFKGEWFADLESGLPYFESILVKNPNLAAVREYVRQAIISTPFVQSISSLELDFDRAARALTIDWRVVASDATVIEGTTELES